MIPATLTLTSVLADAVTVVSKFDTLILIVAGAAAGFVAVRFVLKQSKHLLKG